MRVLSILAVLAIAVGSAFAIQPIPDPQAVPDASVTAPICAETMFEPPVVHMGSSYWECIQSYVQCVNGCQAYPEPTQTQCENWCFQTHWCTQV